MKTVQTEIGRVYADIVGKTEEGRTVYSILSVPYAQGKRFEYAKILNKKDYTPETVINRTETVCFPQRKYPLFLNILMKHHILRPEFQPLKDTQTENAFVVNIWAPDNFTKKKPVLVFLHGGGEGSGTVPIYTMAHIAEQGIVAVTITYRIGNFGYMPVFEKGEVRGSLSYLDQQAALTWIHNNINSFGGDNTNITLMGHCGGAVAALYHYLNPLSNNLFHKLMLCAGNVPILSEYDFAKNEYEKMLSKNHLNGLEDLKKLSAKKLMKLKGGQGEFADSLESELKPEANGIVDLQIQIMELLVFHSSALFLMEKIGEKSPVYGYRMNYIPNLYNGLRGSYHGAELAFFFGTIDNMNIHITDENKAAVIAIQKDWIQFIKFGKIEGRPLFNETGKITEYDKDIKTIPFPHANLIHHIQKSGIADKLRKEYIQNRR